jgi:hypothetical protein
MSARWIGLACLVVALGINQWTVAGFLGLHGGLEVRSIKAAIWAFQLASAAAGLWLLKRRGRVHAGYLVVIGICIVALLAGAEAIARTTLQRGRSPLRTLSPELGWQTAPATRFEYDHPAFGHVSIATGPHGFRRWDTAQPHASRLLVIGDSYTEAAQVSNGLAYFDHLATHLPGIAVFAYGTGGYGTLQQVLVVERHLDSVRADAILWQLSANDFINNDHFLESRSPLGSRMNRPYYENGAVVMRFAGSGGPSKYSRLVRFLSARIASVSGHGFSPASLDSERASHPGELARAIRTTRELMERARRSASGIPIYAFTAEGDSFSDSVFQSLAEQSGWRFIPGVRDSIADAGARGMRVDGMPRDGHWNANGHAIAGRVIARHLMSGGFFRKQNRADDRRDEHSRDDQEGDLDRNVVDGSQ